MKFPPDGVFGTFIVLIDHHHPPNFNTQINCTTKALQQQFGLGFNILQKLCIHQGRIILDEFVDFVFHKIGVQEFLTLTQLFIHIRNRYTYDAFTFFLKCLIGQFRYQAWFGSRNFQFVVDKHDHVKQFLVLVRMVFGQFHKLYFVD